MLTLSPSAIEAVDSLLQRPDLPDDAGLRISSTAESQLTIGVAPEPGPGDQVIEQGGARVFVEPEVAPMLDNLELDAHTQDDQIAFGLTPPGAGNGTGPAA
ncbi:MAG TPA: iron-sulfur cluster biosynthesis family protein [Solirubrobacteraceae bacterium]|jgi:Fe-S cluster assembly iron-binding protein IscA|nr:iron-sulfur cluster biosynthesis family protein [Solirubrobacteraceae bacterium]